MASTDGFTPRVDFLPPSALTLPGRLGLTRAPGRPGPGRSPDPDDWLRQDLDGRRRRGREGARDAPRADGARADRRRAR